MIYVAVLSGLNYAIGKTHHGDQAQGRLDEASAAAQTPAQWGERKEAVSAAVPAAEWNFANCVRHEKSYLNTSCPGGALSSGLQTCFPTVVYYSEERKYVLASPSGAQTASLLFE